MSADLFWAAPEVLRSVLQNEKVALTKEADIFSLGVVLKQLLCKNLAYSEELAHQSPKGEDAGLICILHAQNSTIFKSGHHYHVPDLKACLETTKLKNYTSSISGLLLDLYSIPYLKHIKLYIQVHTWLLKQSCSNK